MAFDALFDGGIVDRTDLRIASQQLRGLGGGDVASHPRAHPLRLHLIDSKLSESEFVVQQVSTGETIRVRVRPRGLSHGICTAPRCCKIEIRRLQTGKGHRPLQDLQWAYAKKIVTRLSWRRLFYVTGQRRVHMAQRRRAGDPGTRKDIESNHKGGSHCQVSNSHQKQETNHARTSKSSAQAASAARLHSGYGEG